MFVRQLPNVAVACEVVKMPDNTPAGLLWGIRSGFRDYLDALEDTVLELRGVERTAEGFLFPARAGSGFGGSLHAVAHAGALDVTLRDPDIEQRPEGVLLTADLGDGRRDVAMLLDAEDAAALRRGATARDVALTLDGSVWLGGVYAPWARMDPVEIRAPRSGASAAGG
jgi:hypothetical protein